MRRFLSHCAFSRRANIAKIHALTPITHNAGRYSVFMPFRPLHLSPKILQAIQEAGYTEPT
ncbi:MAG TPA: hypothetical protein VFJ88_04565, partial [Chthoniobacterales bacterium]|nr:hypothetical protein [Chthoniobacterales bacterium]